MIRITLPRFREVADIIHHNNDTPLEGKQMTVPHR